MIRPNSVEKTILGPTTLNINKNTCAILHYIRASLNNEWAILPLIQQSLKTRCVGTTHREYEGGSQMCHPFLIPSVIFDQISEPKGHNSAKNHCTETKCKRDL
jgi:hypothetical protein